MGSDEDVFSVAVVVEVDSDVADVSLVKPCEWLSIQLLKFVATISSTLGQLRMWIVQTSLSVLGLCQRKATRLLSVLRSFKARICTMAFRVVQLG